MDTNTIKLMWCIIALAIITHMLLAYKTFSESQSPNYIFSQEAKRYFEATTPKGETVTADDIVNRWKTLKSLKDEELISDEEFKQKKSEYIDYYKTNTRFLSDEINLKLLKSFSDDGLISKTELTYLKARFIYNFSDYLYTDIQNAIYNFHRTKEGRRKISDKAFNKAKSEYIEYISNTVPTNIASRLNQITLFKDQGLISDQEFQNLKLALEELMMFSYLEKGDIKTRLINIKKLKDKKLISENDFKQKMDEILKGI